MSDPTDIFRPAFLKIERAKHHINDFNRQAAEFFNGSPMHMMTHVDSEAGRFTHFIKQEKPIPEHFPLLIGDAIHNLRSALDLAVFAIVGNKATNPESVQFPFARKADTLVQTMKSRQMHLAGENVFRYIESLQPYPDGNEKLHVLYTLDVTDKHKLIILTFASAVMPSAEFANMIPGLPAYDKVTVRMRQGAKLVVRATNAGEWSEADRAQIPTGEYKRVSQPVFEICFGEPEIISGIPVLPILGELVPYVEHVISGIRDSFRAIS